MKEDPIEYQGKYGDSLLSSDKIPDFKTKSQPTLTSNDDTQYYLELEGDVDGII